MATKEQKIADTKKKIDMIDSQMTDMQMELDSASALKDKILYELGELNEQLSECDTLIKDADSAIEELEKKQQDLEDELVELEMGKLDVHKK